MSRPALARVGTNGLVQANGGLLNVSLEDALKQTDQLSQQIAGSLSRLGNASTAIETAIKPISGSTQTYTNIAKNVEATISELQAIRLHQAVFEEEEPRIRRGNLEVVEYLQSIARLKEAIKALEASSLKSSQQVTLKMNQLIIVAVGNVRERYRKMLSEVSRMADSTTDRDIPYQPEIQDDTLTNLSVMVDFFMVTDMSAAVPLYADIRGKYIMHHLSLFASRVLNSDLKRSEGFYVKGSSPFKVYIDALTKTMIDKTIRVIFKAKTDIQNALTSTLKDIEVSYQTTLEAINSSVRKSLITDCFYAFDILELVHAASGELLLSIDSPMFSLESSCKDLRKTAQDSLTEMLRHIEASVTSIQTLPVDFTALDVTRQLSVWIKRLAEYDTTLTSILIPLGPPYKWNVRLSYQSTFSTAPSSGTPKSSYMGTEILALYISECIDDLLANIESKARAQYKKVTRVGLQVIANLLYIERAIRTSRELLQLFTSGNGFERLEKIRKRALNMFLDGWKVCASYLMDVTVVRSSSMSSSGKGTMSSKDRETIKEKFKNFNTTFDELTAKFKEYNFVDPELRAFLAKEVAFIAPLYQRFYDKHKSGEFSKHTEKYIKYTRQQLEMTLASLA